MERTFSSGKEYRDYILSTFLEIEPISHQQFLIVKETLSRIGVGNKNTKTLWQTCHILHKGGRYFIVHFKELFALDGKAEPISGEDLARRNAIAVILEEWDMVRIKGDLMIDDEPPITIVRFNEKAEWTLKQKYAIGGAKVRKDKNAEDQPR